MANDVLKGQWKQLKGSVRREWGDLTDDEVEQIGGERERLVGKIQEKYGRSKREAEDEVDGWLNRLADGG